MLKIVLLFTRFEVEVRVEVELGVRSGVHTIFRCVVENLIRLLDPIANRPSRYVKMPRGLCDRRLSIAVGTMRDRAVEEDLMMREEFQHLDLLLPRIRSLATLDRF